MVMGLDFYGMGAPDKSIWFGILALMVVEIGLVHPPLGMNLFIIQKLAKDVPYFETAKGVMPFLASDLVRIVLLVAPGHPDVQRAILDAWDSSTSCRSRRRSRATTNTCSRTGRACTSASDRTARSGYTATSSPANKRS
jgi:hypothetical protein